MSEIPDGCEVFEGYWIRADRYEENGPQIGKSGLKIPRTDWIVIDPSTGDELSRHRQKIEAHLYIRNLNAGV